MILRVKLIIPTRKNYYDATEEVTVFQLSPQFRNRRISCTCHLYADQNCMEVDVIAHVFHFAFLNSLCF